MPISGTLDLGATMGSYGSNSLSLLGEDGNHYVVAGQTGATSYITIGQLEDKSVQTITSTSWRDDLQGLAGTLTAVVETDTFTMCQAPIHVPGTSKFIVLGVQYGGTGGYTSSLGYGYAYAVGVIYRVNASSAVEVVGGFLRKTDNAPTAFYGTPGPSWCFAAIPSATDTDVVALCWCGFTLFAGTYDTGYLLKLPTSGTTQDTSTGSWTPYFTRLTNATNAGWVYFWQSVIAQGRTVGNTAGILPRADGTYDVISYVTDYSVDNEVASLVDITTSGSEYWNINQSTSTVNVAKGDARSWFGQPWDDEATTYAGAASANARDCYGGPDIRAITGGYEITFARLFSDQPTIIRFRRYIYTTATDTITYVDTFEKTVTGVTPVKETAFFQRLGASQVIYAIVGSGRYWYLGEDTTPVLTEEEASSALSRQRAWTFTHDGHTFYVLDLGSEGNWLYDVTTGQWCEFITSGFANWDMVAGVMWDKRIVAGDRTTNDVWECSAAAAQDNDALAVTHTATGVIPHRSRNKLTVGALRASVSPGQLTSGTTATMSLYFSDDGGSTWTGPFSVALTEGEYDAEVAYRALGSFAAPGRIFRITDVGGPKRIDGCDVEIPEIDNAR